MWGEARAGSAGLEAQLSPAESTLQLVASTPHLAPGARLVQGQQGQGPAQARTRSTGVGSAGVQGMALGLSRVWGSCWGPKFPSACAGGFQLWQRSYGGALTSLQLGEEQP